MGEATQTLDDLIDTADVALDEAKNAGGDRVEANKLARMEE